MDEVSPSHLSEVCRLCSCCEGLKLPIFGDEEERDPLSFKILVCVNVEVNNDDVLSTLICQKCLNHVNEWHQFKQLCDSAQAKQNGWLTKLLQLSSNVPDVDIKSEPPDELSEEDEIIEEEIIEEDVPVDILGEEAIKQEDLDDYCHEDMPLAAAAASASDPLSFSRQQSEQQMRELKSERQIIAISIGLSPQEDEPESVREGRTVPTLSSGETAYPGELPENIPRLELDVKVKGGKVTKRENNFFCSQCGKRFGTRTLLSRHELIHAGARFECSVCGLTLSSSSSLSRHMRIHTGLKPYSCAKCRKTFPGRSELCKHRRRCAGAKGERPVPIPVGEGRVPGAHRRSGIVSRCTTCNLQFSRKGDLKKHVDLKHPASCRWCKRVFPNRISLRLHLKTHMRTHKNMHKGGPKRIKRYLCKHCPVVMFQWSHIVKHRQLHLDDRIPSTANGTTDRAIPLKKKTHKPYVCLVCNETFSYWKEYMKHKPTHYKAGKHREGMSGRLSVKARKTGQYQCETCDESFTKWYAFVRHRQQHDSNDLPSTSDSKVVQRQMISKSKPPTLLVKKTLNSMERNPKCPICLKQFRSSAMARHMTSHTDSKNFSCPICHRKMKYESSIHNHLQQVHQVVPGLYRGIKADPSSTGDPPSTSWAPLLPTVKKEANLSTQAAANVVPAMHRFTCHVCDKSFTSKDFLLTHHQIIHKGARGYKCKLCPQVFLKESLLEVHETTHVKREVNRAAPLAVSVPSSLPEGSIFKCAACPKAFNSKKSLVAHQNRVGHVFHKPMEIKMKIFSCSLCHNSYNNETALRTHRLDSHGLGVSPELAGEYDCHVCRRSFSNNAHLKRHLQNVHLNGIASTPVKTERPSTAGPSGSLNCDLCGKRFKDTNSLKTHRGWHFRVTHTSPKLEQVSVKHNQDGGPRAREADSMHIDVTDQIHECHICQRVFASSKARKLHLTKTHGYKSVKMEHVKRADDLSLTAVDTTPKVASTSNNSLESSQEFRCSVCQKAFQSSQSCRMHFIKAHSQLKQERTSLASKPARAAETNSFSGVAGTPGPEKFMCGTCQKSFNTDKGRKIHMAIVHGVTSPLTSLKLERTSVANEPDNTPIVDRTARQSVNQCNEDGFPCFVCQKSFSTSKGCKIHITIVHPSQSREELQVTGDPSRRGKEASALGNTPPLKRQDLVCDLCVKPFRTPRAFNIHYAWHMRNPSSIDNVSDKVKKQLIENYVKDKIANTPPTLKKNQPISASPTLAQMQRSEKRSLPILTPMKQSGMPSSNSKTENALACHICTLTFPSDSALQSHIGSHNATSPGLRDCSFCQKSFTMRSNLVRHLRMCKMNLRKEKLPRASYFVDCHFCHKTFGKRGNLLLHLKGCMNRIVAPEPSEPRQGNASDIDKSRECQSCLKVFSTRFNLLKHVKICRLSKRNISVPMLRNVKHENVNKNIPTATDSSTLPEALPAENEVDMPLDKTRPSKNTKAKRDKQIIYHCNMCPNEYKLYRSLLTHKIWHSRKSNVKLEPEATQSQETVAVPEASTRVGVPSTRNSHLLKGWTCDICSQLFLGKRALTIHRNTHKLRQKGLSAAVSRLSKVHTCKTCNKTFTNPGYLRNHIRQVHVKQIFSTKLNGKVKKAVLKSKKKYIMFEEIGKQMAPVESVPEMLAPTPTVSGLEETPNTVTEIEVNH